MNAQLLAATEEQLRMMIYYLDNRRYPDGILASYLQWVTSQDMMTTPEMLIAHMGHPGWEPASPQAA